MATITKSANFDVDPTQLLVARKTTAGNDIIVVPSMLGLGGTIDGGGGTDELRLHHTAAYAFDLDTDFTALVSIETVVLGTGTAAAAVTTGTLAHGLDASGYVLNGLTIVGNAGANTIIGTAFADTITGNAGVDSLDGGDGGDTYIYSTLADFVAEDLTLTDTGATGTDTVRITATTGILTLTAAPNGIEAYVIAGAGAVSINASAVLTGLTLTGSTGINALTGTGQDDIITGGAGADNLQGGLGDDIYDYLLSTDFVTGEVINDAGGTDTVRVSAPTGILTLSPFVTGIDLVVLAGAGANGVNAALVANGLTIAGNDGANTITGTAFVDIIAGGLGNDTITGGAGADELYGGTGNDIFIVSSGAHHGAGEIIDGEDGIDTIQFTSTVANDTLTMTSDDDIENIVLSLATATTALNVDASAMIYTGLGREHHRQRRRQHPHRRRLRRRHQCRRRQRHPDRRPRQTTPWSAAPATTP
jgi:Ca2+-binding RTX toxin-like protein